MRKVILVILDGLGIGTMPDVKEERPQDLGANTLINTVNNCGFDLHLPTLEKLGLGIISSSQAAAPVEQPLAAFGKAMLKHFGADTFAGHQELMGTKPVRPTKQLMKDIYEGLARYLTDSGFRVDYPFAGKPFLLVDGHIAVHDNMEGEIAQNINVTGSMDEVPFAVIEEVGQAVREYVKVGRVIVVGGRDYDTQDILDSVVERPGQIGVDTPGLGVYDENYQVRHLGYGIKAEKQVPTIAVNAGLGVTLIGKAADVIRCENSRKFPIIDTEAVFDKTVAEYQRPDTRLVISNVQETDLAGHEQDPKRYGRLLGKADVGVRKILDTIKQGDYLIVTADHGNDPTIGHGKHTREMVPLLVYSSEMSPRNLGTRETLADTGATISRLLGLKLPESGTPYV